MSARASAVCALRDCSGAMYPIVPSCAPVRVRRSSPGNRASPKSSNLACPSGVTSTFDGFRSRWIRPSRCASISASAIWWAMWHANPTASGATAAVCSRSVPGISSITKYGMAGQSMSRAGSSPASIAATMFGCLSRPTARASRKNRARVRGF
nr:hypothetical protein [Frigoriglobus tundricola]